MFDIGRITKQPNNTKHICFELYIKTNTNTKDFDMFGMCSYMLYGRSEHIMGHTKNVWFRLMKQTNTHKQKHTCLI